MLRISGNLGFITNSSSAIFHFPRILLEDSRIQAFLQAYGITDGYIGSDLWHRGQCETLALTPEQKRETVSRLEQEDYGHPTIETETDQILVIYGDEYLSLTSTLGALMTQVAEEKGLTYVRGEYN